MKNRQVLIEQPVPRGESERWGLCIFLLSMFLAGIFELFRQCEIFWVFFILFSTEKNTSIKSKSYFRNKKF